LQFLVHPSYSLLAPGPEGRGRVEFTEKKEKAKLAICIFTCSS